MAYSLVFWRDESKETRPVELILSRLDSGDALEGLAWIPVAQMKQVFVQAFPEINDCGSYLDWEGANSYFQVHWPTCSKPQQTVGIFVEAGYELLKTPAVVNRIIEVGNRLGCALYDPQAGERYDQPP